MVRAANMLHQRLLLASALSVIACAQIAGFEQLSSPTIDDSEGGSSTAGAAGGVGVGAGAAFAGSGQVGGASAGRASVGASSRAGSGGNAAVAGSVSTAGATTGTAGSTGGTTGTAGSSGGTIGSAGSSGGTTGASGAAGAPVTGGCNAQLLKNAAFDAGPLDWRLESTAPGILELSDVINQGTNLAAVLANVTPRSASYLAWLGGVLDSDKASRVTLTQDVQIPVKVSKLVLSGWIQIRTTEPDPNETTDQLDLTLQDDKMYWSFHFWKGTDVATGWKSFSYEFADAERLNALRGRTLTFYAEARGDTTEVTSYWLDSLSLFAECP